MWHLIFLFLPSVWSSDRHHLQRKASSSSAASHPSPLTHHSASDLQLPALCWDSFKSFRKSEPTATSVRLYLSQGVFQTALTRHPPISSRGRHHRLGGVEGTRVERHPVRRWRWGKWRKMRSACEVETFQDTLTHLLHFGSQLGLKWQNHSYMSRTLNTECLWTAPLQRPFHTKQKPTYIFLSGSAESQNCHRYLAASAANFSTFYDTMHVNRRIY